MMNEEWDQFEKRLRHQPLRRIPAEWREEILAMADRESRVEGREPQRLRPSFLSTLSAQLSTILWPHPAAWAGLAAVWLGILVVDFSVRDQAPLVAKQPSPPSPQVMVELRQQQRLLAELIGPREPRDADRSKSLAPRPRSELHIEILTT